MITKIMQIDLKYIIIVIAYAFFNCNFFNLPVEWINYYNINCTCL